MGTLIHGWWKCKMVELLWRRDWWFQWLRICLATQGTQVRSLVQEDPTCQGATKLAHHSYSASALELTSHNRPCALAPVLHNKRSQYSEKPEHRSGEQSLLAATRARPRAAVEAQCSQK